MKNRNNSRKERIAEFEVLKGDMSYTAYITKENTVLNETIRAELKNTEESIHNLSIFINDEQTKGTDVSEFIKGFHELYDKQQKLEKELEQAASDRHMDMSLLCIAQHLDRLEIDKQNINDIREVGIKVDDAINLLTKVCMRSGGWGGAPGVAEQMYRALSGAANCINGGICIQSMRSKEQLLNDLIDRMDELNSEKDNSQTLLDKYKALLKNSTPLFK